MNSADNRKRAASMASVWHKHKRKIAFHFVFVSLHLALFVYGYFKQKNDPELYILNEIGASVLTSRAAGLVLALDLCLVIASMLRTCITFVRTYLLPPWMGVWINLDNHTYLHRWSAYAMLFFAFIHVNCHYANFFTIQRSLPGLGLTAVGIHYHTWAGITGHIMLACAFLIYTTAESRVRKAKFELFWYTHHLFILFYAAAMCHALGCFVKSAFTGQCKGYLSRFYMAPLLILYVLERVLRQVRARRFTEIKRIILHPGRTIELQFIQPSLIYRAGQYVFLNIPQLSRTQWHPFTISSSPEEPFISLHIKVVGDWTEGLLALLLSNPQKGIPSATLPTPGGKSEAVSIPMPVQDLPLLRVDGPYGAPAQDFHAYDSLVLISTGIGVTPSASLLKHIWYDASASDRGEGGVEVKPFRKIYLFWINREAEAIEWFHSLLETMEATMEVEMHLYVTNAVGKGAKPGDVGRLMILDGGGACVRDPVTALRAKTHYGRPYWPTIFAKIKQDHAGGLDGEDSVKTDIGVFCCGPASLARSVEGALTSASSPRVRFHLREELF